MRLRPSQRRLLDEVAREIERAISVPDARRLPAARDDDGLLLANPQLQPVAFAVRHTTRRNYVYGAAGEAAARAVFIFFTTLWLLASVAVGMMALLALFNLHLQALKVLKDSQPEFYKKQKRSVQRFERQRWSAQRRRHNVYKRFCVDTRAPVLYLRSFSFGVVYESPPEVTRKVDERLAEHYEQYGR